MILRHETVGDVLVIEPLMSSLDATSGEELRSAVEPLLEEEAKVVFDLGRVGFVDRAGLAALLSCLKHIVAIGGDLKLCATTPRVQHTFESTRLPKIIEIHPTRGEAVSSYA